MRSLPKTLLLLAIAFLTLAASPSPDGDWRTVVEGIDFQLWGLSGPNRAYVARMDLSNQDLTLETSIAAGRMGEGKETVSSMARRYDEGLTTWDPGWGSTSDVVIAINGSFHDLETGVPLSGLVHGGWYAKRFDELGGGSGFAWRLDRKPFIGGCVDHDASKQLAFFPRSDVTIPVARINNGRGSNELVMYTAHYDVRTPGSGDGIEVLVQMDQPAGLVSWPDSVSGTVVGIRDSGGTPIPFDHLVLSAHGQAAEDLQSAIELGDTVALSAEILHYESDCRSRNSTSWEETYASLSGSFPFLANGEIKSFHDNLGATARNPRTAICFNDDYLFFVVVDGRQSGWSVGMTIDELAFFCRDRLGATWGMNMDGGGSSAMWVDGQIVNSPSDGRERAVANGLMMVQVQPPQFSNAFEPRQQVQARELIDLRLGPGENFYGPFDVQQGEVGTLLSHPKELEGVYARGENWWFVDFGGREGWVIESGIQALTQVSAQQTGSVSPREPVEPPLYLWRSLLSPSPGWLWIR